jgi:hypothetical protein
MSLLRPWQLAIVLFVAAFAMLPSGAQAGAATLPDDVVFEPHDAALRDGSCPAPSHHLGSAETHSLLELEVLGAEGSEDDGRHDALALCSLVLRSGPTLRGAKNALRGGSQAYTLLCLLRSGLPRGPPVRA